MERVAERGTESGVGVVDGEGVGDGGEVGGRGKELGVGQVDAADGGGEEGLEDVSNQTSESGAVLWGSVDAVLCDATSNPYETHNTLAHLTNFKPARAC